MRKNLRSKLWAFLLFFSIAGGASAQQVIYYGTSPFQDSLWGVDTTSWTVVHRIAPSLAGFTVTGITGFSYDPVEHEAYCVAKVTGVTGRVLCKIDPISGVMTQVGNLGDNFSSITFRSDGQMMGVTGDGATTPETLFLIDKTNASKTLAIALGNGADGEVIAYNFDDGNLYHWSGNGTVVYEKFPANSPYTPVTNIPITGTPGGEVFGSLYIGNGKFLVSNISSNALYYSTTGTVGTALTTHPDDLRGLVMPPVFHLVEDTICLNETLEINMTGLAQDSAVYNWGDGTSTTVFPAGGATHNYTTNGNFTVRAMLSNPTATDTLATFAVRIQALPGVVINPSGNVPVCDTNSITLVGANGGQSQWYMNGAPIPGATSTSYAATAPGIYNMVKTNLNGCSDSAAVSATLAFGNRPVFDLGSDTSYCAGDTICYDLTNVGSSYLWSDSSTSALYCANGTGEVSVAVYDVAGCVARDTVMVTELQVPNPSPIADTSGCPNIVFDAQDADGSAWTWDFGDGNTGNGATPSHTYSSNGTYTVSVSSSNACGSNSGTLNLSISCIVGISSAWMSEHFNVFPNPSNGTFHITGNLPLASTMAYRVLDIQGREIASAEFNESKISWNEAVQVNASKGIYFIHIRTEQGQAVLQMVIE